MPADRFNRDFTLVHGVYHDISWRFTHSSRSYIPLRWSQCLSESVRGVSGYHATKSIFSNSIKRYFLFITAYYISVLEFLEVSIM